MAKNEKKSEDRNYVSRTETIRGKEYTVLYTGVRTALEAQEIAYPNDDFTKFKVLEFAEYVFKKELIVSPDSEGKLGFDDFDTQWELKEVMAFALNVITGLFREQEYTAERSGKE